jgi:hypothetical protein
LSEFDDEVHATFESFSGIRIAGDTWRQATLSIRRGGLGLRNTATHAAAAYLSSRVRSRQQAEALRSAAAGAPPDCQHVSDALEALNRLTAPSKQLSAAALDPKSTRQGALSGLIEDRQAASLLERASLAGRARLRAVAMPHAGAWLTVIPSRELGLALAPAEFSTAARLRLGCAGGGVCEVCGASMDDEGQHALQCQLGGDMIHKHNGVRDSVYWQCAAAGLKPELEKAHLTTGK